jgi:CHASE2 domain-containing sensor protein
MAFNDREKEIACADDSTKPIFIEYSFDDVNFNMPAPQVLQLSQKANNAGRAPAMSVRENNLENKLVLLGGDYDTRDEHFTPIGKKPGLIVLANAIQTELDVKKHTLLYAPLCVPDKMFLFTLEFIAGIVLVIVFELGNPSVIRTLILWLPATAGICAICLILAVLFKPPFQILAPTLFTVLIVEVCLHLRQKFIEEAGREFRRRRGSKSRR